MSNSKLPCALVITPLTAKDAAHDCPQAATNPRVHIRIRIVTVLTCGFLLEVIMKESSMSWETAVFALSEDTQNTPTDPA